MSRLDLGPTQHPVLWVPGVLFWGQMGQSMNLVTCHHVVAKLRMSRAMYSFCGALAHLQAMPFMASTGTAVPLVISLGRRVSLVAVLEHAMLILHFSFPVVNCCILLNKVSRHLYHNEENPEKCCSAMSAHCVQRHYLATSVRHDDKGLFCDQELKSVRGSSY